MYVKGNAINVASSPLWNWLTKTTSFDAWCQRLNIHYEARSTLSHHTNVATPGRNHVHRCNKAQNFGKFRQRLKLFLEPTDTISSRSWKQKAATILHVARWEASQVFISVFISVNILQCSKKERESYSTLVKTFVAYCTPSCNKTYQCYIFRLRVCKERRVLR